MRPILTVCLVVIAAFVVSAAITPLAAWLLPFPVHRIFKRALMVTLVGGVLLFRRAFAFESLSAYGLVREPGWPRQMAAGLAVSLGGIALGMAALITLGAQTFEVIGDGGLWARKMAGALGAAAAVALIEELAFRGYLLHIALRRLRVVPAAITTSVLYALVHYVRVPRDLGLADRFQPLAGIEVVWGTVNRTIAEAPTVLAGTIGLTLFGAMLAWTVLRTRKLWYAIGLHAGAVLILKLSGLAAHWNPERASWVVGAGHLYDGAVGWIVLAGMFGVVVLHLRRRSPRPHPTP